MARQKKAMPLHKAPNTVMTLHCARGLPESIACEHSDTHRHRARSKRSKA